MSDAQLPQLDTVSIPELVNEFGWRGCMVDLDGTMHIVLSIRHPRHGDIHLRLGKPVAENIRDWLTQMTVPQTPTN